MEAKLPLGWRLLSVESCMSAIIDYRGKSPNKTTRGIPLITAKVVKDGRILPSDEFIPADEYEIWMRRGLPRSGDVVVTTEAPLGEVAQLGSEKVALAQRLILLRANSDLLDQDYLLYVMQSSFVQRQLNARSTGTTVHGIRQSELRRVILPVPPLVEQKRVGHTLSLLDKKSELNRSMNQTLEAMARAIFKSWFVDFEPTRKRAGHFKDSLLGSIPSGWSTSALGEHVEIVRGLSYKGSGLATEGVPLHNLNSVYEGGGYKREGIKFYRGESRDRHLVMPGDLIVANTEQGHDQLLIGYPALIPRFFGDTGIFSHHLFRLRVLPSSSLTPAFLYYLFLERRFRERIVGYASGTTVNMLPIAGLQRPLIVVPPAHVISQFEEIASPMLEKIERNYEESETLASLRDTVLPKLLSGEIRVKQAEKIVGEVV